MMLSDPTVKLICWTTTRTAEVIAERIAERIATRVKARFVTTARHHAVSVLPKLGNDKRRTASNPAGTADTTAAGAMGPRRHTLSLMARPHGRDHLWRMR